MYYNPLHKYFIRDCIKLEDQIKSRKAAWLLAVKDYIRQKKFYNTDAEILVEFRKTYTDNKGKISFTNYQVKKKIDGMYNIDYDKKDLVIGKYFSLMNTKAQKYVMFNEFNLRILGFSFTQKRKENH